MLLRTALVLVLLSACTVRTNTPDGGGGDRDGAPPPSGDLRIEPMMHEATIAGSPVIIDYRAFLMEGSGEREVTSEATWSVGMPALGSFNGARFTSANLGGTTNIQARLGDDTANATLTLRVERTIVTAGTPADAPTRFGGTADPSRAPELVYPNDGVMVPPNLSELEFHYRTSGAELFELHIQAPTLDLRIYFGCPESVGGGCIYTPDREAWEVISTAARGQGEVTYRLRGVDASGNLGETAQRTLIVAEEDITGGLYYWNAAGGVINRFEFGVRGAQEERFISRTETGAGMCVGCHTLSRDGRRIAVGTDIPTTTFQVFDVATRSRVFMLGSGGGFGFPAQPNFASFNPGATQIATSSLEGIDIRDATNGNIVLENLGGEAASMPDWSPDGQHIAWVSHDGMAFGGIEDVPGVTSGSIERLDWNGSSWVRGPTLIQRTSDNNYYPAYSPDGQWVLFNRSPSNTNSMGPDPDNPSAVNDAQLWVVSSSGTGVAMRLTRAGGYVDSWPKWDPTEYLDNGRPIFWFAWSSRRGFGLRYAEDGNVQLWMAAFDPSLASSGDPALPAFRLPFQNIASGNHIAQWVTRVERRTCTTNADCGGEFCVEGRCYEQAPLF